MLVASSGGSVMTKLLTKDSKYSNIISTLLKNKTNKRKDSKMSKQTKTKIKVVSLVAGALAYAVGASVVGLPELTQADVISLAYFGIGGGLLFWVIERTTK